jgi:hypothetical protein
MSCPSWGPGALASSLAFMFHLEKCVQHFKTSSLRPRLTHLRPRQCSVARQASGLERDKGRFGAKAAGLKCTALQASGFCAKLALVALEAAGLERDTTCLGYTINQTTGPVEPRKASRGLRPAQLMVPRPCSLAITTERRIDHPKIIIRISVLEFRIEDASYIEVR